MNSKIKVIFFDVGNTLLFPNRARIHAPLVERGFSPESEHLRDLECRTKNEFDGMMTANGSTDHNFWRMFYSRLLSELGITDDALLNQLVASIRNSGNWDVILPGTAEQLDEISQRFCVAVISNADGKIKDVLEKRAIARCFRTITDSGIVGFEKPHSEIFRRALDSMEAKAEESLYVGDVYSVDYLGARSAGMQAVLMDVPRAYTEKDVPRVESLAELQSFLDRVEAR